MIVFANLVPARESKSEQQQSQLPVPPPPPPMRRTISTATRPIHFDHSGDSDDDDANDDDENDVDPSNTNTVICIGGSVEDDEDDSQHGEDNVVQRIPDTSAVGGSSSVTAVTLSTKNCIGTLPPTGYRQRNANGLTVVVPSGASSVTSTTASSSSVTGKSLSLPQHQQQQQRILECDYDQSPTPLYMAIEAKQWNVVLEMLENDDNSSIDDDRVRGGRANRPYPMSPKQQACCWVVRKEKDGRLRWRLLPIHAAIIFDATATVIEALIEAYPSSASQKDDQGMLPLHLAFRNITLLLTDTNTKNRNKSMKHSSSSVASNSSGDDYTRPSSCGFSSSASSTAVNWLIVEELLTAYPQAIFSRDRKGRTPLHGGIFAAQQALKHESKQKSHNSPNQRKMAALKVLDLYSQITAAGEKSNWLKEYKQKTNQRLAALAEQHAYRLQEFHSEFIYEQQVQNENHQKQLAALQSQIQALQHTNSELRTEIESYKEAQQQHLQRAADDHLETKEKIIEELQQGKQLLMNQVNSLTAICRSTAAALQLTAAEHEQELNNYVSVSDTSFAKMTPDIGDNMQQPPILSTILVSETKISPNLEMTEQLQDCDEEHGKAVESSFVSSHGESLGAISTDSSTTLFRNVLSGETQQEEYHDVDQSRRLNPLSASSLMKPPRLDVSNNINDDNMSPTNDASRSFSPRPSSPDIYNHLEDCISAQDLNTEIGTNNTDSPVESRDEERDEDEGNLTSRKLRVVCNEETGDQDGNDALGVSLSSSATSESLSFDEIKNEILAHSVADYGCANRKDGDRKGDQKSVVFDQQTINRRHRSLPLITIRSDDERDMIATMSNAAFNSTTLTSSPCTRMATTATTVFPDVVGVSCVAEGFFMTSNEPVLPPDRISGGTKNALTENGSYSKFKLVGNPRRPKRLSLPDIRQLKHVNQALVAPPKAPPSSSSVVIATATNSPSDVHSSNNHCTGLAEKLSLTRSLSSSSSPRGIKNVWNMSGGSLHSSHVTGSSSNNNHNNSGGNCGGNGGGLVPTSTSTTTTSMIGTSNSTRSLLDTEEDE